MTHNLISGRQALAMVANRPPKRVVRQLETGDRVHIPTIEEGWYYGQLFHGGCPEMFWANAEVFRPSTGQTFTLPIFISYFVNEIKDVDGNMHVCTVDGVLDLDEAKNLAEQATILAGCIFEVHVDTFQAWETTREGVKRQRERSTYAWTRHA